MTEIAIKVMKSVVDRVVKDAIARAGSVIGDPLVQERAMDLVHEVARSWVRSSGPAFA